MKFTIFTPTYNRENTLPRLYESLKNQTFKDFEWIIVDDGSFDSTETLIKEYISENTITIKYYKQPNQGKHIAINTGVKYATGEYFLVIDSDDYLINEALFTCNLITEKTQNDRFAGFTFIRFQENITYDKTQYGQKAWVVDEAKEINYDWEYHGEMVFCYKTVIAQGNLFPFFEGEKFCPESIVHRRIARQYKILATDHVLASGEYLKDGLSSRYSLLMERSPRTSMLGLRERLDDVKTKASKKQIAATYWNIALKAKNISWFEKCVGLPFNYTIEFWYNRLLKKNNI